MQLLAQTDEMTGLLTKSATRRRIDELLEEYPDEYFAYFIFDIDNFKQANDQFGHAFGDTVIRSFTQTLFEYFRKDDTLGRIGGDEFVAFVRGSGLRRSDGTRGTVIPGVMPDSYQRQHKLEASRQYRCGSLPGKCNRCRDTL